MTRSTTPLAHEEFYMPIGPDRDYDVIIGGAGPVGLFLASELALQGLSTLVLERNAHPDSPLKSTSLGIRGIAISSVESFYRRGMLGDLKNAAMASTPKASAPDGAPTKPPGPYTGHFASISIDPTKVDTSRWTLRLPTPANSSLPVSIGAIETFLAQRATSLGVEIRRGAEIAGFEEQHDGVTVRVGNETFSGKWLVGCDGGRSAIRKLAGFEFVGTAPEGTGYIALVDLEDPEKIPMGRNLTPLGVYTQNKPGHINVMELDHGAYDRSQEVTSEHLQAVLRRVSNTDVTIKTLHVATTFTDSAMQATNYRKGRVLLCGDAAHIHSPLGGQGLNCGIGDAMNLGWKLASEINGTAPGSLLETYNTERHPIGEWVVNWSRAQAAAMRRDDQALALEHILRDLINTTDGATYFADKIWGANVRYDLGDDRPIVGRSAPDFELDAGSKLGESMAGGRGVLLDFGNHEHLRDTVRGHRAGIIYISTTTPHHLGLEAILVRPDGVVAWIAENDEQITEVSSAINRWFGVGTR